MGFFVVSVLFAYFWSLGGVLVQTWRVTDVLSALLEIFFTIAFLSLPSYTTLKLDDKHSHEDLNVVESCLFWPRIDLTFHVISSDPKQPYLPPLKKDIYVFFKIYLAEPGRSCGTQDLQFSFRLLPFFFFFLITDGPQKRLPCTVQVTSGGAAPGIPTTSLVRKRGWCGNSLWSLAGKGQFPGRNQFIFIFWTVTLVTEPVSFFAGAGRKLRIKTSIYLYRLS